MNCRKYLLFLAASTISIGSVAQAEATTPTANDGIISFRGNISEPTCEILSDLKGKISVCKRADATSASERNFTSQNHSRRLPEFEMTGNMLGYNKEIVTVSYL